MHEVFHYESLDSQALTQALGDCDEVNLEIPKGHSGVLISLLSLTQLLRSSSQLNPFERVYYAVHSSLLILWITLTHNKIHEIYELLVDCNKYEWHQLPSGSFLFRFSNPGQA